jgi:hypothetical protein
MLDDLKNLFTSNTLLAVVVLLVGGVVGYFLRPVIKKWF